MIPVSYVKIQFSSIRLHTYKILNIKNKSKTFLIDKSYARCTLFRVKRAYGFFDDRVYI